MLSPSGEELRGRPGKESVRLFCSTRRLCPLGMPISAPGALICSIARKVLHIAAFRYVDDFYGPEREEAVQHTRELFARFRDLCKSLAASCSALRLGS